MMVSVLKTCFSIALQCRREPDTSAMGTSRNVMVYEVISCHQVPPCTLTEMKWDRKRGVVRRPVDGSRGSPLKAATFGFGTMILGTSCSNGSLTALKSEACLCLILLFGLLSLVAPLNQPTISEAADPSPEGWPEICRLPALGRC
jgi:hypothetical protein